MIEQIGNLEGTINKAVEIIVPTLQEKEVTPTNQTQNVVADEGYDALSKVVVNEIPSQYIIPSGTIEITQEGTHDVKEKEYADVHLQSKWANMGYNQDPEYIDGIYNVALNIYSNWDSSIVSMYYKYANNKTIVVFPLVDTSNVTSMSYAFYRCSTIKQIPLLNTSNVTNMSNMFASATRLEYVPVFNTSKVTNFSNMFDSVEQLNDESLNNILKMCIGATSYTGTKKLSTIGIDTFIYEQSKIQSLPDYQNFINAGWVIK